MKNSGDFSIGSAVWPGTSKLLEEMGELGQVLGKLLGSAGETAHYDGTDLRQRLVEELGDLHAALVFFQEENLSYEEKGRVAARVAHKLVMFRKWHTSPKE